MQAVVYCTMEIFDDLILSYILLPLSQIHSPSQGRNIDYYLGMEEEITFLGIIISCFSLNFDYDPPLPCL